MRGRKFWSDLNEVGYCAPGVADAKLHRTSARKIEVSRDFQRDWSVQNGGAHQDAAAAAKVSFTRKNAVSDDEKRYVGDPRAAGEEANGGRLFMEEKKQKKVEEKEVIH